MRPFLSFRFASISCSICAIDVSQVSRHHVIIACSAWAAGGWVTLARSHLQGVLFHVLQCRRILGGVA